MVAAVADEARSSCDRSEVGSVKALVDIIHKQQADVTVDIGARIEVRVRFMHGLVHVVTCCVQGISLSGLTEKCHPEQEPTNRLAALKAKQLKAGVLKPFPLIELSSFLPSWAEDVGVLNNPSADIADCDQQRDELGEFKGKKKQKLDLARWLAAYQCYALAASAAEVCAFMHQPFAGRHDGCCFGRCGNIQQRWRT